MFGGADSISHLISGPLKPSTVSISGELSTTSVRKLMSCLFLVSGALGLRYIQTIVSVGCGIFTDQLTACVPERLREEPPVEGNYP